MKTLKSILAAVAITLAATAGAQTLKMEHQTAGVTTYEASTLVNLVVVKPEVKIDNLDPSVLTVNTNGVERNVLTVYPSDARGAFNPEGEYLALGLDKATAENISFMYIFSLSSTLIHKLSNPTLTTLYSLSISIGGLQRTR